MNQSPKSDAVQLQKPRGVLFWLSLFIVIAGLMNAIPGVPGLDTGLRNLTGLDWIKIRRFPTEWFLPSGLCVHDALRGVKAFRMEILEGQTHRQTPDWTVAGSGDGRGGLYNLIHLYR